MEWQIAGKQEKQKRVNATKDPERPNLAALAQGLANALKQQPYARPRKPEWCCQACGVSNFMDRQVCRRCGLTLQDSSQKRSHGNVNNHHLPAGSVWADPSPRAPLRQKPKTPAARVSALEALLASARSAGASGPTLETLESEVADAKQNAEEARVPPLGARLDSARAKLTQAEKIVVAMQEQVEQALARQEEALKQVGERKSELAVLEAEVGRNTGGGSSTPVSEHVSTAQVLDGVRTLLQALENSRICDSMAPAKGPPEPVLIGMRHIHDLLDTVALPRCQAGEGNESTSATRGMDVEDHVVHQVGLTHADGAVAVQSTVSRSASAERGNGRRRSPRRNGADFR